MILVARDFFLDDVVDGGAIGPSAASTPLILSFCFLFGLANDELIVLVLNELDTGRWVFRVVEEGGFLGCDCC